MTKITNLQEFLSTNTYPILGIGDWIKHERAQSLMRQSPINDRFKVEKDITELFGKKGFKKHTKQEEGTKLILEYSNDNFDEKIEVSLNDVIKQKYTTINVTLYQKEKETIRKLEKELTQTENKSTKAVPTQKKTIRVPQHLFVTHDGYFAQQTNKQSTRYSQATKQPHQYGALKGH